MYSQKIYGPLLLLVVAFNSSAETASTVVSDKKTGTQIPNLFFIVPNLPVGLIVDYLPNMIQKGSEHLHKTYLSAHLKELPPTPKKPKNRRISIAKSKSFKSLQKPKSLALSTPKAHYFKSYLPKKISIQGGVFMASQGRAQHINMYDLIGDDFSVTNQNPVNGLVGLGLYWDGLEINHTNFSYGLNAFYLAHTETKGLVTRENLYTNLSYNYSLTQWPIYFAGKAIFEKRFLKKTNITMDGGLGFNIIEAKRFKENSLVDYTVSDTVFLNNTQIAFSATAGIGLKINEFFGQTPLECGYRFFYLGQGTFKPATDQILDSLKTGTSYANALICSVTL